MKVEVIKLTKKDLRRLSRAELLELLLNRTREIEQLREELRKKDEALENRRLAVEGAGDIAKASLAVNEVMEAAQRAADQYLENIKAMEEETRLLLEKAREQATE